MMNTIQKCFLFPLFFIVLGSAGLQAQLYPGDVNDDGIVDNVDFLYVGTVFGLIGPPRDIAEQGIFFEEKTITTLWGITFDNGLDYAYADCNGDGVIDFLDLDAVLSNFGLEHGIVMPEVFPGGNPGVDPPLLFDGSFIFGPFPEFTFVAIPVSLGTEDMPVNDFNGIAFEIHYDPTVIVNGSIDFNFSSSWINDSGNDLHFSPPNSNSSPGVLKVAATRTAPLATSNNYGQIGTIQFVIEDNLVDYSQPNLETMLEFQNVTILGASGNPVPTVNDTIIIEITDNEVLSNDPEILEEQVSVSPNPFNDRLNISAINTKIESIGLYNVDGRLVRDWRSINQVETELFLDAIPVGVYLVKIQTSDGVITKKLSKF